MSAENLGVGLTFESSLVVDIRVEKMQKSASKLQKMKSLANYLYFTKPEAQKPQLCPFWAIFDTMKVIFILKNKNNKFI